MSAAAASRMRFCRRQFTLAKTMKSTNQITASGFRYWPELDLIRGIACAMMVINHAGYKWLTNQHANSGATGVMVFIGSFAPVVFFFVTGVGIGLRGQRSKKFISVIYKALLLILANELLSWAAGRWVTLDFLGFIGLTMIILECISRTRRPQIFSAVLFLAVLLLRFIVGPVFKHHVNGAARTLIANFLGVKEVAYVGYPICPWLSYPLLGYLLGSFVHRYASKVDDRYKNIAAIALLLGVSMGGCAFVMASLGFPVFRWGLLSIAYFIAGIACLSSCIAVCLIICRVTTLKSFVQLTSLRGVSSLAVVPLHYGIIELTSRGGMRIDNKFATILFASGALVFIAITFWAARRVKATAELIAERINPKVIGALAIVISCIIGLYVVGHPISTAGYWLAIFGQLALCMAFAEKRRGAPATQVAKTSTPNALVTA
jgi:uncharacterized membrane protein